MPIWRLQTSIWADSLFPRDAMVINPHFNDHAITGSSDPQGLCEDLANALDTWLPTQNAHQISVRAYDAQGTPPVFPAGEFVRNVGGAPAALSVREVALCLSYFSGRNTPRQRGRLYIPVAVIGTASQLTVRPGTAVINKVKALVPIFTGLGGVDVDWSVYSRVDDEARAVSDWWVDDEWDIIRSRGLRPGTRQTGTVSE